MFISCWSVKGGSGTTVVAASLALLAASSAPPHASASRGALLVDLGGDAPAALGLPEPVGPGLHDWLAAPAAGADALVDLSVPVTGSLRLLPAGHLSRTPAGAEQFGLLATALGQLTTAVVVDVGVLAPELVALANRADRSLLVLRPCYLALRRASALLARPSGLVLVREPGRALGRREIEDAVGVRIEAELDVDPTIARAVDAGLLASRLPRGLARPLRAAA